MEQVPENFTCPKGHTHHNKQFLAHIDLHIPVDRIDESITFTCPGGDELKAHRFTLAAGIKSGMFTERQAELLRRAAIRQRSE